MNTDNLFPIGTVVTLKEGEKSLMIIGLLPQSGEQKFDYMSVLYPEGYLNEEYVYFFNQEDIADVEYLGYMNAEYQVFRNNLRVLMNSEETQE